MKFRDGLIFLGIWTDPVNVDYMTQEFDTSSAEYAFLRIERKTSIEQSFQYPLQAGIMLVTRAPIDQIII
jgi:hypothetical protein